MMAFKCHFVLSLLLFFCASSFLVYGGKNAPSASKSENSPTKNKSLAELMAEETLADRKGKTLADLLKFDKIDGEELDEFLKENVQLLEIAFDGDNPQNVQLGDHDQFETPSKLEKKKGTIGEKMKKKLKGIFALKKNDPVMAQIMENLYSFIKKIIKGESPQKVKDYLLFTVKIFALRERISLSENVPKNKSEINHSKLFKMILEESKEQKKKGNSERRKTILTSLYDEVRSLDIPSGIEIKSEKKGKRKSRRKKRQEGLSGLIIGIFLLLLGAYLVKSWIFGGDSSTTTPTRNQEVRPPIVLKLGSLIIDNLPKHTIDEENRGGDCPICRAKFEVGDEFPELQCKHQIHTECFRQWLNEYNSCPACQNQKKKIYKFTTRREICPQQLPRGK
ncbi:hypothetical protein niasHS_015356 [Heterodera schachtii]|uniref:RING-type domain-containing protein n=1 Tax=Heterodera schachtii TaxID=97005 RepID=A0ABD2I5I1_HETSC